MSEAYNDKELKKSKRKEKSKVKLMVIIFIVLVIIGLAGFFGVTKASDNPKFCTICHNMQSYYDSYADSTLLANVHAESDEIDNCHTCHEPSIKEQVSEGVKYITGSYEDPLETRDWGNEFCLACHDDFFETAVEATAYSVTVNIGGEMTEVPLQNPHENHNELVCSDCHRMHQKGTILCMECHDFTWFDDVDKDWFDINIEE